MYNTYNLLLYNVLFIILFELCIVYIIFNRKATVATVQKRTNKLVKCKKRTQKKDYIG